MNWKNLLKSEMEAAYKTTEGLMGLVDPDKLDWKPSPRNNWMSMGQLIQHLSESCGMAFKGFITGDWGMPDGMDLGEMKPEDMLPPAEKMKSVESLARGKTLLEADKKLAFQFLADVSEADLQDKSAPAPWDTEVICLGYRLLQMIYHLNVHKSQLFYYLKLQGKPVHTGHLWGM